MMRSEAWEVAYQQLADEYALRVAEIKNIQKELDDYKIAIKCMNAVFKEQEEKATILRADVDRLNAEVASAEQTNANTRGSLMMSYAREATLRATIVQAYTALTDVYAGLTKCGSWHNYPPALFQNLNVVLGILKQDNTSETEKHET